MKRYIGTLKEPNRGHAFPDVYNVDTLEPKAEWLDLYYQVKEDLASLGLNFTYSNRE